MTSPASAPTRIYRNLDPAQILLTAEILQRRISERFPGAGLGAVGSELVDCCREAEQTADWLAKPNRPLRVLIGAAILLLLGIIATALARLDVKLSFSAITELLQALEAGVNDAVFIGLAVYFLTTLERRRKRKRALAAIHVLRSLAHIIDMHQLTKDPERVTGGGTNTQTSPKRVMTPFELTRYLDYCSEMLSIISKAAALYVQHFDDSGTLAAVKEIEDLANGLSRKIWQKIMILDRSLAPDAGGGGRAAS